MSNEEFSNEQVQRIDAVENAVYDLCKFMTGDENLEWNAEFVYEIADCASDILVKYGHKVYFPTRTTYEDGREEISDYYPDIMELKKNEQENARTDAGLGEVES